MSFSLTLAGNIVYRILNIVTGFFITLLLTRLMSTEGYGVLSLLIANVSFFNLLSCLGAESGIIFHSASGHMKPGKVLTIIYSVIIWQLLLLLITEMIHYSNTGHYWLINGKGIAFLFIGLIYLLSITITDKYTALLNGHHLYMTGNRIIFFSNGIALLLFCIFYFGAEKHTALFYLVLFVCTCLIQAVLMIIAFHVSVKEKIRFQKMDKADVRIFFSYSFIVFITNCIQFMAYRVDFWLVNYYQGKSALGIYALAVKLNQLFWVLPLLAASIVFPMVAAREKQYDEKQLLLLMRVINTILLIAASIAFFAAPWLIPFLFGEQYRQSVGAFLYLVPGFFMFGIIIMLAAYYAGKNQLRVNLLGSSLCFGLVFLLDLWLIPKMGIKGAAIASSLAYSATTIFYLVKFSSVSKQLLANIFFIRPGDWPGLKDFFRKAVKRTA
jgi:O-antigen/teichoic acid export membrane protein